LQATELLNHSASYDSLLKVNKELMKYKDMVVGNENSDLIITLSKTVKTEKENNDLLRKQNKALSDSLSAIIKNKKFANKQEDIKTMIIRTQLTKGLFYLSRKIQKLQLNIKAAF
jgi:hypothetical protein